MVIIILRKNKNNNRTNNLKSKFKRLTTTSVGKTPFLVALQLNFEVLNLVLKLKLDPPKSKPTVMFASGT